MKKTKIGIIAIYVMVAIALSASGQVSRADSGFEGGDGTLGNPYLIRTPEQLDAIRNNLSAHYKLVDDIDMSEFGNWEPIGGFKGTLDGNGYSILNLKSHHDMVAKRTGLFGILEGTVKNLQLINVDVYGHDSVGGIAGEFRNGGIIQNSFVTGIVKAQRDFVAGIVALDMYGGGKIENTYAAAEVISEINSFNKGGIVSFFYGSVINSYYDQELSGPLESGKGIPKSTAEMKQQSTYQCWDFTNRWAMDPDINDGYPYLNLRNITELAPPYSVSVPAQAQKGGTTIDFQWTTRSYCGEADGETYEVQFYDGENWHDIEKDALTISYNADNSVKTGSYTLPSVNTKEAKFRVRAVIDSYTSPYTESEAFTILSTPPTLTLDGDTTIRLEKGNAYVEPGATATDAVGNNLSNIVINGTVDTNTVGTYTLTYSVEDSAGNHTALTRTVVVAPHKVAIVGDYEAVRVANADTNALITLYQKQADGSIVKIREEAATQSELTFVDIPAGKDYYATQTVNDIESFPSNFVEVLAKVPPSAPPSVTTPPPLTGGKHTVSWGAITDWGSGKANSREYHIFLHIDGQLKSVVETGQSDNPSTSIEIEIPADVNTHNAELWVRGSTQHGESAYAKSGTFIIDNTNPTVELSKNGGNYAKHHSTKVTATDSHSGIDHIEYVWTTSSSFPNTGFVSINSGDTIDAPTSSGDHYLHVRAADKAGNVQAFTSQVFQIDTTDPTLTITPSTSEPTNQDITLTVTGSDAHSGVRRIRMAEGTWVDGDSLTHTVTENGTYSFDVEDHVGNTHTASIEMKNIDKVPPVITIDPYPTEPTNQDITVTATTDKGTLNQSSYTFTSNGSFEFIATDEAGNVAKKTVTITNIDKIAPTVSFDPDGNSGQRASRATTEVTVDDDHSGVDANSLRYIWTSSHDVRPDDSDTGWKPFASGDELSLSGKNGDWYLHVVALDQAGNEAYVVSDPFSLFHFAPSGNAPSAAGHARIVTGMDGEQNAIEVEVTRKNDNGMVIDEVTIGASLAEEIIRAAANSGSRTVHIVVDDDPDKPADEVVVYLDTSVLHQLSREELSLSLMTRDILITLPSGSMNQLGESGETIYFRLVPVQTEAAQQQVRESALREAVVRQVSDEVEPHIVARPMTIDTNMPHRPVTLVLPLREVQMPTDEQALAAFLNSLAVFIEHSDGEKVLMRGRVVSVGDTLGLEITIRKFSTFAILSWNGVDLAPFWQRTHQPYIQGYPDGTFRPEAQVTRAQMAAMLSRNLWEHGSSLHQPSYSDVSASHWAFEQIERVRQAGIMTGYAHGAFGPNDPMTRAQMAAIVHRWVQTQCAADSHAYPFCGQLFNAEREDYRDVPPHHWAREAILAIRSLGIMEGYADNTFRPEARLTRAQAVKVLNRLFSRGPLYGMRSPTFTDVPATHWAFHEIEEAAREHSWRISDEGQEIIMSQ